MKIDTGFSLTDFQPKSIDVMYIQMIYKTIMIIEYDENKRQMNIKKHKIDFKEILDIFENPMVEIIDTRQDYNEERIIGFGLSKLLKDHPTVVVAVYVEKVNDTIRIISARKALKHEQRNYYKKVF